MIELSHVTKTFESLAGRPLRAVDDVSMRVGGGEVVGIAGPEGAGKTTLVSLILGLVAPTSGSVRVGGRPARAFVEREGVGYLPEVIGIPRWWRVAGALERFGVLAGLPPARIRERVGEVSGELGLDELRRRRIRSLAPGELRRLGLAQALIAPQRVLILEELVLGLDAEWNARVRDLVSRLRAPDRAILVVSRDAEELQRLADRVVVIDRGAMRRVVSGAPSRASDASAYRPAAPGSREVV